MFNSTVQPTGVYSAFQRPNSAVLKTNTGNKALNPALSNNSANENIKSAQAKKTKKTLKQRLPMLSVLLLAASYGVIYGLPAGRRQIRKLIAKKSTDKNSPFVLKFKNKQIETIVNKDLATINKYIDTLEDRVQKNIRNFLKTNFFKY